MVGGAGLRGPGCSGPSSQERLPPGILGQGPPGDKPAFLCPKVMGSRPPGGGGWTTVDPPSGSEAGPGELGSRAGLLGFLVRRLWT